MGRQLGLHLIAKLRHDAALSFPYEGLIGTDLRNPQLALMI